MTEQIPESTGYDQNSVEQVLKPNYFGPITVLYHPNRDCYLDTTRTNAVVLNSQRIGNDDLEVYQYLLTRRPSKTIRNNRGSQRVIELIDETSHHYFRSWAKDDPLTENISLAPKPLTEQLHKTYDRTLMVDESEMAPWVAEVYQPWIMLGQGKDILGVKSRDIVTELMLGGADYAPLVGSTSHDLRVAFVAGSSYAVNREYRRMDLRERQALFFERQIERPDLIIA